PNSAGSNRRAPDCPNSDSVPHTPATIGFPQGLPPEPARAVRIRGPHTRPLPAPRGAEIDLRAAVLGHRLAAGPEAVARPFRHSIESHQLQRITSPYFTRWRTRRGILRYFSGGRHQVENLGRVLPHQ